MFASPKITLGRLRAMRAGLTALAVGSVMARAEPAGVSSAFSLDGPPPPVADTSSPGAADIGVVTKVIAFDGIDPRQTLKDYARTHQLDAADVERATSATGKLKCGDMTSTANLVLDPSILVTTGHSICSGKGDASNCTFTYSQNGRSTSIKVGSLIATGYDCSNGQYYDWAVLRLSKPALGPHPYQIDPAVTQQLKPSSKILAIYNQSTDFCEKDRYNNCLIKSGEKILPKTIQECSVRYVGQINKVPTQLFHDCASAEGSSGGAMLAGSLISRILVGIQTRIAETDAEVAEERKKGTPFNRPFSIDKNSRWYARGEPVNGALAEAIIQAASTSKVVNGDKENGGRAQ